MKERMMRKAITAVGAALLSLVVLTGCQTLDSTTAYKLESVDSFKPAVLNSFDEQKFRANELSESFEKWLDAAGWNTTYKVDGSPLVWVPEKQDSAFPSTVSENKCAAWVEWESGYEGASSTAAYIYRVSKDGETVDGKAMAELMQHLSSDIKRQGWEPYELADFGSEDGSAGQFAWYSAPLKNKEYTPLETYYADISGEAEVEYLSYRIMAVDRGDGYLALYISSPCAPIETDQYEQLRGDIGSSELDLIKSDAKNPNNSVIRP